MAINTSIGVDELNKSRQELEESTKESINQYNVMNQTVEDNIGAGTIMGESAMGRSVVNHWQDDTVDGMNAYRRQAESLLSEALSKVSSSAQNNESETESIYSSN